jgi:hypothetical protein
VDFSFDRELVTLRGDAHVYSEVVTDPSKFVRIDADLIEGDLSRARFEMVGDVTIETPRGMLKGDAAVYNARTSQYSLKRGGIMVPLGEGDEDEEVTCGFAYAREVATEGEIVYLTSGRFTTCSRADPHYSLRARRFRWNPETTRVVAYGGSLQVYGMQIPLVPEVPFTFERRDRDMPSLWPFPTYTTRDGLRLGWSFAVNPLGNPSSQVKLSWRQLRPLQVSSRTYYRINDSLQARLGLGLREDLKQDIDRIVPVDRFPELGLAGEWDLWGGDYQLETDLSAGHFRQRREGPLEPVAEDRLRLQARLTGNPEGLYEPGEMWWWVDASGSLYGNGQHYEAYGAGIGSATELTDWFAANAELRQWATGGRTPFAWDDVDVKTELESNLQFKLTDSWRTRLGGRYDISNGELRAWDAEIRRRDHCLTWKVGYTDISNNFKVGVEINGLFGNDEPPKDSCPAEGPPDYWEQHASGDQPPELDPADDASETQSNEDTASEAMETQ